MGLLLNYRPTKSIGNSTATKKVRKKPALSKSATAAMMKSHSKYYYYY